MSPTTDGTDVPDLVAELGEFALIFWIEWLLGLYEYTVLKPTATEHDHCEDMGVLHQDSLCDTRV